MTRFSKRQSSCLTGHQAREMLEQLVGSIVKDAKTYIDSVHSEENQGQRLRKNIVILWFVTKTSKGQMTDVLQILKKICWTKKKTTVKTLGQAWSWALRGNSWRRPEQCSTGDLRSCQRRRRKTGSHLVKDPNHDVRQDWCLGKQGSCAHVFWKEKRRQCSLDQ